MSNYRKLADDLMHFLDLSLPPIAISFSDRIPAGVTSFDGVVPAGCVFWQLAATRTFVTYDEGSRALFHRGPHAPYGAAFAVPSGRT